MPSRLTALRDPVTLAVGALAVARLTRLVTEDELTRPVREAIEDASADGDVAWRFVHRLVNCPWCVSVWAASGWATLTVAAPVVAVPAGAVLAWSAVAGHLSSWE